MTTATKNPRQKLTAAKKVAEAKRILYGDALWREIVFVRAGYRSEISGRSDIVQAHHIFPKGRHPRLRWWVINGICLTKGEHRSHHEWDSSIVDFWFSENRSHDLSELVKASRVIKLPSVEIETLEAQLSAFDHLLPTHRKEEVEKAQQAWHRAKERVAKL